MGHHRSSSSTSSPRGDAKTTKFHSDRTAFYPVIVVGAGISGIAAGCRLREKLGCKEFRIFDRYSEIGGTWWIHQYPGVACDIPASLYSLSFAQNPSWSTLKPPGGEIMNYLKSVCEKYRLTDKIQLNTEVMNLRWDEQREQWEATLAHLHQGIGDLSSKERDAKGAVYGDQYLYSSKETVRAKVIISAVGKFLEPKVEPAHFPGLEQFKGDIVHTARWDNTISLQRKDVVVVGSGCSAAQVVPEIASSRFNVKSVTQLVRSPPWVIPNLLSPASLDLWEKYMPWLLRNIPGLAQIVRFIIFILTERDFYRYFNHNASTRTRRAVRETGLIAYMKSAVPEMYHGMLTPNYQVGCKRLVHDAGWLRSLQEKKVRLSDMTLKQIEENAVILEPKGQPTALESNKVRLPADAIILATGYETETLLPTVSVTGRDDTDLHKHWEKHGGPQAYLGIAVDKFPNLFFLNGPNTSLGHTSIVIGVENALLHSLRCIKHILEGEVHIWEVGEDACRNWASQVQAASQAGVWIDGGCSSWYIDKNGWNIMLYPFSQLYSAYRAAFPTWTDWNATYTPKGIRHRRRRRLLWVRLVPLLLLSVVSTLLYLTRFERLAG